MKKFNFKWLLLSIILSIASINTAWADMYMAGSMNSWSANNNDYKFVDNKLEVTLDENETYTFKIVDDGTWRSFDGSFTNTSLNYELDKANVGGYNISIATGEAGTYIFQYSWYDNKHHLSVYYPQARLTKNTILYFDGRNSTQAWGTYSWGARFFYKYYDSGDDDSNSDCTTPVEDYVHYTTVPNHDYIGQIQVERKDPSDMDGIRWNYAAVCCAYNRANSTQNCMAISDDNKGWDNNFTPIWTTYCPPTKEETLSDNGSSIVPGTSGTGTSGNPILVIKGTKLKVTASANKSVADGNMTVKYDFKVNKTSQQDGTSGSYSSYTASTNNAIYKVSVDAYTNYKLDNTKNSTKHTPDTLYYKALNEYTIKYYGGTNAESGSHADDKQYHGIAKTLPGATFTRANYTQTGWTTSDGGAKVYDLSTAYTANTNLNLYPVWTEVPYDITATAGEGGSVGSSSYTAYVVTTCAISATPNTGYKFSHWSVESGSATFADQYSASTTMNATSDAKIKANFVYRWSIAGSWKIITPGEGDPYWDPDNYAMGNIGTNASSKDTCYVEISLAANTSYTFDVVDRSTSLYTFHKNGNDKIYYMTYGNSTNWGFGTTTGYNYDCGITTAGAGTYKFAYNITDGKVTVTYPNSYTVTFGYGTGGSAVSASVEDAGSINSGDYATAGKDITFTKTAANLAYTFKGWYNASSDGDAISCMASDDVYDDIAANISVYAQFKTRYGLHGSLMDNNAGGMPGWAGDGADFTVVSYTDIGEGTGKGVDLECSRTLEPNKEYKFRVQDRAAGSRWGLSESAVLPAEAPSNNVKLNVYGDESGKDVYINTVGYGTYTFKITNMYDNGDGKYYPAIQVDRPASSKLTLGWKHYTNDALSDGDTGGTVTAATNEGSGFAITNRQFYANGSNLTFTAAPATGYHVEGWYSDASCSSTYTSGEDGATIRGEGNVTLELASVSTNKTVYVKFTEDTKEATSGDGGWEAKVGDSKITDVVTISSTITVDVDHAKAKRVILDQSGDGKAGKLVVAANKGLEVAEGIWINNGTSLVPPTASDLVLESSASGNATLIFNNSNSAAATVQMYSKASVEGGTWNWQYMAPAFTDANALYDYYGSYLYVWNDGGGWSPVANGATLDAFAGYCITNKTANSTYVTDGTLVPTTSHSVTLGANEDMVIGNSWTAPIYIGGFTDETFTSTPATIYLFNTGSAEGGSSKGTSPGTYVTIPVNAAPFTGNELIAPLQAFFVTTVDGSAGTITMNYDELVRTTTNNHSVNAGPMYAPKRVNEEEDPEVMKIWAIGAEYSDRLVILEREDFTTGFDNGWDGEKKSFSDVAPSVYVIAETEKDAVSAVPDYEGTILGFLAGIDTQCAMNFDYNGEENWYLNDLKEEKSTLITNENSYSFSCSSTDAETRFVISRTPIHKVPTGTENVNAGTNARKQMINGVLYVIRDGRIYNAEGAVVK